jgi:hypothetical protein
MGWQFPVAEGTPVEVRLYLMNGFSGTSAAGQRIFDIQLDGETVVSGLDLSAEAGHQVGTVRTVSTVSDGMIDLEFIHVVENPLINGIEIVAIEGVEPEPGALSADPVSVGFGEVEVDGSRAAAVGVTNSGGTTVTVAEVSVVGDDAARFAVTDGPATPFDLAPGASAEVQVTFSPVVEGPFTATLRLGHTGTNNPLDIALTGEGVLTPTPVAPTVTITDGPTGTVETSDATFTFTANVTGATFECRLDAAAWTPCTSPYELTGLGDGTYTFEVRATADGLTGEAASRTWTVELPPDPGALSADPLALSFGEVAVETPVTLPVTLTNSGEEPVTIDELAIGGADAAVFAVTGTPPATVAAGGTAQLEVTFTPTTAGEAAATLTITHSGTNTPLQVGLSGTGVSPVTLERFEEDAAGVVFSSGWSTSLQHGPLWRRLQADRYGWAHDGGVLHRPCGALDRHHRTLPRDRGGHPQRHRPTPGRPVCRHLDAPTTGVRSPRAR